MTPYPRIEALRWLAVRAPLEAFHDCAWTAFVRDDAVRPILLGRLGRESRAARRLAARALRA